MMIVKPVIVRPLTAEWEAVKAELDRNSFEAAQPRQARQGRTGPRAEARLDVFLKRLDDVRILDPACGSGNFLYLALQSLKDLERRAIVEAEEMGLGLRVIHCGPAQRQRHRDQSLCGRTGAHVDLDRQYSVDAAQWL